MPDCRHMASLLEQYIDGELRPEERGPLEKHVEGCPRCHRDLQELTALRSHLQKAVEKGVAGAPLAGIWEGMAERLETPTIVEQLWWELKNLFYSFRPRTALAWGAAIVILFILIFPFVTSPPTPRVVVESVESEHPVMIFQGDNKMMVVWLFVEEEGKEVMR
jgi:anti-sigma factor RsiW